MVSEVVEIHIIITITTAADLIITEILTIIADSETQTVVPKITREIRTTVDSGIRTAAAIVDSETKAAVTRIIREIKVAADSEIRTAAVTVDSEILKVQDPNRPAASETAQAAKAARPTDKAVDEALDKTIINKETNS